MKKILENKGGFFYIGLMKRELTAALIIRDKKVLLVHNAKHGLRIEPPGGKRHDNESWEGSVEREVEEELGIKVKPLSLFGTFDTHSPEGEFSVRMYLCEITSGEPKVMEPEKIPSFGWYSFGELQGLKEEGSLVPNMAEALQKLKNLM